MKFLLNFLSGIDGKPVDSGGESCEAGFFFSIRKVSLRILLRWGAGIIWGNSD
jgi:hypothetical protein